MTALLTPPALVRSVACAGRAPSLHNSQPWTFLAEDDVVQVRAARSRWLPAEDPTGRELLLSCGGAVRHLALGLRAEGLDVEVRTCPEPLLDPDLVAEVRVVGRRPASLQERALHAATEARHTERSAFGPQPVPAEVREELRLLAEAEGCVLTALDADRTVALAVLTDRGERLLHDDAARAAEQRSWWGRTPGCVDGLPSGALPEHGAHRASPVVLRDVDGAEAEHGGEPPVVEHPLVLVLSTDTDDVEAWVRSGWALSSLLLALTARGLVASPMTQALEVAALRERLRADLGLVGHPQMALRVGHPQGGGSPRTGRRPVADLLPAG